MAKKNTASKYPKNNRLHSAVAAQVMSRNTVTPEVSNLGRFSGSTPAIKGFNTKPFPSNY